jgi:hypothetical protein
MGFMGLISGLLIGEMGPGLLNPASKSYGIWDAPQHGVLALGQATFLIQGQLQSCGKNHQPWAVNGPMPPAHGGRMF